MDIESAEWNILEQWHNDGLFLKTGQLIVEIHMWSDILQDSRSSTTHSPRFASILKSIPMNLFAARQNIYDGNFVLLDEMTRIYELGFLERAPF